MSLADSTISSNVQDLGFSLSSAGVFAFLNPVNTYREIPGCSQEFPETLTVTMTVGVSPYSNDPSQNLAKSTVKKLYSKGYSLIDQTIRRISSEPSAPSDGCEQFPGPGIYIPPTGVLLDEDILCFVEPNPNDLLAVAQSHRDVSLQGIASLAQEFELANGEQPVFVTWERFETVLGLVQAAITLLYNGFLGSPEPAF